MSATDKVWFKQPSPDETARKLSSVVDELERSQYEKTRRQWLTFDLELFTGERIDNLDETTEVYRQRGPGDGDNSQIFNVTYSIISTILNRICSFRPRAQFLPNAGDGKAKRAARDMTALSDAWSDTVDYQSEASDALADALTGDAGVMKLYEEEGTIKIGRFPNWEFMVDEIDGKYGVPECIYHVRYVANSQAAAMLGVDDMEVPGAGQSWDSLSQLVSRAGRTRIIDAWQRGPKGKHVTLVGNGLMTPDADGSFKNFQEEEWEYDGFPLVIERYQKAKTGMWGRSATSLHRALQVELNEQQLTFREAHRMSATKIIHKKKGNDSPTGINNGYVVVDEYTNTPITIDTPPALSQEAYNYVNMLRDQAYETHGVSKFGAQAQTKPGVTAAVAMREDTELQSDRLALLSQKWEHMRVEAARWWWRLTRDLAKRMAKDNEKRKENGEEIESSKPKWKAISNGMWKEMVFDDLEGEYEIGVFPSSLFGHSIAGQFQKADDLVQKKWMSQEDAMAALNVPDINGYLSLFLSEKEYMEKVVDDILESGDYTTPDPFVPPEKMFAYAKQRYFRVLIDQNSSPTNVDLLRRLLNATKPAQETPAPPAAATAPAAPGTPGTPLPPPDAGAPAIAPPGAPTAPAMQLPGFVPPGPAAPPAPTQIQ